MQNTRPSVPVEADRDAPSPAGSSESSGSPASPATPPRPLGWQARAGLALLVVCALLALFWPRDQGSRAAAPGGFLLDAGGRPSPLGQRLAPVTLVHFWATWCPPCIDEIPALQRLSRDLAERPGFSVLMIAVADDPKKVGTFMGPGGADMVLFDPAWDVAHRYGTRQLPETYLVVRGRVLEKFVGQTDWDDPGIRRRIAALAAGPASDSGNPGAPGG